MIRRYRPEDWPQVWAILEPIVRAGEAYAVPRDWDESSVQAFWLGPGHRQVWVAEDSGLLVGTYYIQANQLGPGDHVANAGYAVAQSAQGRGLAVSLCRHSIATARELGFLAMQFNFVVSTNTAAVRAWQRCGFEIVGTLPRAFRHPSLGLVDVYVMFRDLTTEHWELHPEH